MLHIHASGRALLVAVSLSHDSIVFAFSFKTVQHLRGAIDVTSDTFGLRVFVVNGGTGAVTVLYPSESFDKTGALCPHTITCSPYPCLNFGQVVAGLVGAGIRISWCSPRRRLPSGVGGYECGVWGVDELVVASGTGRDEVHCHFESPSIFFQIFICRENAIGGSLEDLFFRLIYLRLEDSVIIMDPNMLLYPSLKFFHFISQHWIL